MEYDIISLLVERFAEEPHFDVIGYHFLVIFSMDMEMGNGKSY